MLIQITCVSALSDQGFCLAACHMVSLTITTHWANSDDKMIIFLIFLRNQALTLHANCLLRDNLHEMSKPNKKKKNTSKCNLVKFLPSMLCHKQEETLQKEDRKGCHYHHILQKHWYMRQIARNTSLGIMCESIKMNAFQPIKPSKFSVKTC